MAKVNAHGQILGRLEYLTKTIQYNADGSVLHNYGQGWKVYGKVKADFTAKQAYELAKSKREKSENENPFYANYLSKLVEYAGLKRGSIHELIKLMPSDPDGIWAELQDYSYYDAPKLDIDELVELCKLYNLMVENRRTNSPEF